MISRIDSRVANVIQAGLHQFVVLGRLSQRNGFLQHSNGLSVFLQRSVILEVIPKKIGMVGVLGSLYTQPFGLKARQVILFTRHLAVDL